MENFTGLYAEECSKIIGAAIEVQSVLGVGFKEEVYQDALEIELKERGIPYVREKYIPIYYKGNLIHRPYEADFLCYDKIIVELKALPEIHGGFKAQVINYLVGTNLQVALLLNFGEYPLGISRLTSPQKACSK